MEIIEPSDSRNLKSRSFVVLIALVAALTGILFGFDTGVISGAILFISKQFQLSALMNGFVVSIVLIGALLGALFSGSLADRLGRRLLLVITSVIFLVGTVICVLAGNIVWLLIGRLIVGIGVGMASFIAPLYISEISPPRYRGGLVSLNQLMIICGILFAYAVDLYFAKTQAWRWMFEVGIIPAIMLFIGMLFLPRSPRWLMLKGMPDEAKKILQKLRNEKVVAQELNEIERSLVLVSGGWRLLRQRWLMSALVIGVGLAFLQQATGINAIIYYAPTIFQMAGFQNIEVAILATVGVGFINLLFTVAVIPLIDRWGRRPLLFFGLTGMLIGLLMLSFSFHVAMGQMKWWALAGVLLYMAAFAFSLGPLMWLIISEVFPLSVRGVGASLCVSLSWFFNFLVSFSFLSIVKLLGETSTFLIYAFFCLVGLFFVFAFVPETKRVTLEQIETNLRAGMPGKRLGR